MVTDRERDIIDKAIGDEPPDKGWRLCANCLDTGGEHITLNFEGNDYEVCEDGMTAIRNILNDSGYLFEELTDDDIESMRADEEYSRRKDEGLP